ncbi:MAG TPA: hypothetical protein VNG13_06585 [Mycobacteriales bacterium]|nr:hypothetical protein [Mycobacteriales bacterium]
MRGRVRLDIEGAVAVVINDPSAHDAFDDAMDGQLFEIFEELGRRPEVVGTGTDHGRRHRVGQGGRPRGDRVTPVREQLGLATFTPQAAPTPGGPS